MADESICPPCKAGTHANCALRWSTEEWCDCESCLADLVVSGALNRDSGKGEQNG